MRATFLGTSDGHTSSRRDHSGILLQTPESTLLLDCGAAAARHLLAEGLSPDVPEVLWISHMHSDHNGQLSSLIQSLWLRTRRAPLHIFGPPRVMEDLKAWMHKCLLFPELVGFPIHWRGLEPGRAYEHGPFTLTAFPTDHLNGLADSFKKTYPDTCFDCYGVVIGYQGQRYVYSSDLAHPRELIPALNQGKVAGLICELTHFPETVLFQEIAPYPIQSLWLTHYSDAMVGREEDLRAIAQKEKFRGNVYLMQDRVAQEI